MQCGKKFSRSDHLTKHVATHIKQMQTQKRARAAENAEKKPTQVNQKPETSDEQKSEIGKLGESNSEIVENPQLIDQMPGTVDDDAPAAKKRSSKLTELTLPDQGTTYTDGMHFMASILECTQFRHGRHVIESDNLTEEQLDSTRLPIRIKLERPEHSDEYKIVNAAVEKYGELEEKVKIKTEEVPTVEPTNSEAEIATTTRTPIYNAATTYEDDNNGCNAEEHIYDDENTIDDTIMPEANAAPLPQAGSLLVAPRIDHFERPYDCHQCVKSFKRQDDLNRHLGTHTGEKPYDCTACEKRFMHSDHLKKHLKTHFKQL